MSYFNQTDSIDMDIFEHVRCIENDIFKSNRIDVGNNGTLISEVIPRLPSILTDINIKGRTLVNLFGRKGNHIYQPQLNLFECTASFSLTEMTITMSETATLSQVKYTIPKLNNNSYYVLVGDFKQQDLSEGASISPVNDSIPFGTTVRGSNLIYYPGHDQEEAFMTLNIKNTNWKTHWIAFNTNKELINANINISLSSNIDGKLFMKNLRLYEITKVEFDEIASGVNIDQTYPYVDDVRGVVHPYIQSNENLLDVPNWITGSVSLTLPPAQLYDKSSSILVSVPIQLRKGTYTYSLNKISTITTPIVTNIVIYDGVENKYLTVSNNNTCKIEITNDVSFVIFSVNATNSEPVTTVLNILRAGLANPTLVKGEIAKEYSECTNSTMIFNTTLFDGETLYKSKNGMFVKTKIWSEEIPDKGTNVSIIERTLEGYVNIAWVCKEIYTNPDKFYVVDKDGNFISRSYAGINTSESGPHKFFICIPDSVSGWTGRIPTKEEVADFLQGNKYRFVYKRLHPSIVPIPIIGSILTDVDSIITIGSGMVDEVYQILDDVIDVNTPLNYTNKVCKTIEIRDVNYNELMFYNKAPTTNLEQANWGESKTVVISARYATQPLLCRYIICKYHTVSYFKYSLTISENILELIKDQSHALHETRGMIDQLKTRLDCLTNKVS